LRDEDKVNRGIIWAVILAVSVLGGMPKEKVKEEKDISIVMVGDILLHMPVEESARDKDGNYNFDAIFANVKDEISGADIAIVNQEVIIGGEELGISGYPAFNAPYEVGDALVNAGFDVICHGTNHALDKGKKGIVNACNYWKEKHPDIAVVGINADEDEYRNVAIIEKKGIRIAVLNYTYGTNGISMPKDMPHAVDMLEKDKVIADLKYAEENADFTIVCPHWGTEYNLGTDNSQQNWTKVFREYGADLVIGTHPHVIEPVELLSDENISITNNRGNGDMLVYYSLGNFVSWTNSTGSGVSNRSVGGMAKVVLNAGNKSDVSVKKYTVMAVVDHVTSAHNGVTVYPLKNYTPDLEKANEIRLQDPAFSARYCRDLCNKVWGGHWE
jgi:poly-gamma-glutamate synthesis protein (capsule biosynthesis protein)